MNAPRTCVLVAAVLTGLCLDGSAQAGPRVSAPQASPHYKAIAFDYFVLFNPDSILDEVERVCPGRGRQFLNVWRMRQFEYTWLRSVTGRYVDFLAVTRDALVYTSHAMAVPLTPDQAQRLMDAYLHLDPWPDASGALRQLRDAGIAIVTIANFSPAMLHSNADHAGLTSLFDALISTDANHTYKPDPRACRVGDGSPSPEEKRDRLRRVRRLGRSWREVIRLSHGLGEPLQPADRRAGHHSRSNFARSEWRARVCTADTTCTASIIRRACTRSHWLVHRISRGFRASNSPRRRCLPDTHQSLCSAKRRASQTWSRPSVTDICGSPWPRIARWGLHTWRSGNRAWRISRKSTCTPSTAGAVSAAGWSWRSASGP